MPRLPVTDPVLLKELQRQGINPDHVDFDQDYAPSSLGKRHSPYAKFYTVFDGPAKGKQFMVVSGLSMVDCDGVKCEPVWVQTGYTYHTKANVFSALVNDIPGRITLTVKNDDAVGRKKNDKVVLIPQLFLNGMEVTRPNAVLLPVDPLNPGYLENTLEWDYGICNRRLRQIESRIHGYWVFPANPGGDVRIVYNQTGDYRLKLGQYATDNDTEVIPASVFASAIYPFTVSDSATYYPDANPETTSVDGYLQNGSDEQTWATIHDGAGSYSDASVAENYLVTIYCSDVSATWYYINRSVFLFDTSALPDTASISAAILSLYGSGVVDTSSGWTKNINIYSSNPASNVALSDSDFSYTRFGTTVFATAIPFSNWSITGYNDFTLNTSGIVAISTIGVSKFGLRDANYDAANTNPGASQGYHYKVKGYFSEQGAGYKPKLVVTYTSTVDYPRTSSLALGLVPTVIRVADFPRTSSLAKGMVATASRATTIARNASHSLGMAVIVTRGFVKDVSVVLGMAVTSLRETVISRTSEVAQGFAVTVTRGFEITSSAIMGLAVTTAIARGVERTSNVVMGLAVTVTRVVDFPRTVSNALGYAVTATRATAISRSSSVALGLVMTVSRAAVFSRTASHTLGMAVTATRTTAISRAASVAQGMAVTVTRVTAIARTASTSLGYAVTATRAGAWAITSSVALGLAVTASRSWGRTRDASVSFGHAVTVILTERFFHRRAQTGTNRDFSQTGTNRDRSDTGTNRDREPW